MERTGYLDPPDTVDGPADSHQRPRFAWPAPMPPRRELVVAGVATVLSMAVVLMWSTDRWYFIDDWDFLLARSLDDVGSLLMPHSGHLQLPVGFVYQLVFEGAGFDYWPWFVIPRVLGYGAMTYVMWIVLRRRGADPVVSWIALGWLLFLGSSAFLNVATIGHHLVFPALALAASMFVAGGPRRTWEDQLIFAALALVMVVSTSSGIAAVAALGVVGTCLGRFRAVAPPLAPVIIGYIAWLTANPGGGTEASGLGALLDVPGTMWEMVAPTAAGALALPSTLGPVLAVLLVGVLAVWTLRGRLGSFEAVWLLAAVIWMTMIIVARVVPGPVSATAVRYSYLITWFLVPAIVPHLRLSKRAWVRWVTVAAAVLVVVGNVVQLKAGLDDWVSKTSEVRGRIQAVGILAAAGEPALDASHVFIDGVPGPKGFTVGSVRRLLRTEGWVPDPVVAEPYEQAARGVMRMAIDPGPAGHSCQKVTEGEQLSVRTTEYPAIALSAERRSVVDISYIDRYGTGERTVELTGDHVLSHPVGSNALVVFRVTDGAPLQICQPVEDGGDDSAAVPSTQPGGDVEEP